MKENKRSICHCAHCLYEPECATNDWSLYEELDPCCPNLKKGREQHKQFLEEYLREKLYF